MKEPEEKARELLNKYIELLLNVRDYRKDIKEKAKRCSILTVEEIIENGLNINKIDNDNLNYWEQVKIHIQSI